MRRVTTDMNLEGNSRLAPSAPALLLAALAACSPESSPSPAAPAAPAAAAPTVTPRETPFPPQGGAQPTDPAEILKGEPSERVIFAPKVPELAFVEWSDGLPTSGTWRGYPLLYDFNGDGWADLVSSNREENGYNAWAANPKGPWILSNGGPKKGDIALNQEPSLGYGPSKAADIDGDGRKDLLISAHSEGLKLFRSVPAEDESGKRLEDGALHWGTTERLENPFLMLDIGVGNIDGDPHPDVVGLAHFKGGIGVYLGDGKGGMRRLSESNKILRDKAFGQRLELADLDGDGLDDIVATTNDGGKAWLTRKDEGLRWEEISTGLPKPSIGNSISGLAVGRFTGGKHPEVAMCSVPNPLEDPAKYDSIGVFGWNAEKKAWEHVDSGLPRNEAYRELACADFNGDGKLDLLAFSLESGAVIHLGDGKGGFQAKGRLPGNFGVGRVAISDVDGDGLVDIALAIQASKSHPELGGLRVLLNRRELWK